MLMTRTDLLALRSLAEVNDPVSLDRIPQSFKNKFDRFFFGKTMLKKENELLAYPVDIRNWVQYVFELYKD